MSSTWPLPSIPAMPRISPARTSKVTPCTASLPRSSFTHRSSTSRAAHRRRPLTPRASTIRRSELSDHQLAPTVRFVATEARSVSTCRPRRRTVTRSETDENLLELVADQEDRHALGGQRSEERGELARLLRREQCRRLIQDENVGLADQRLQDLGALLIADAEILDGDVLLDVEAVPPSERVHPIGGRRTGDPDAPRPERQHRVLRPPSAWG